MKSTILVVVFVSLCVFLLSCDSEFNPFSQQDDADNSPSDKGSHDSKDGSDDQADDTGNVDDAADDTVFEEIIYDDGFADQDIHAGEANTYIVQGYTPATYPSRLMSLSYYRYGMPPAYNESVRLAVFYSVKGEFGDQPTEEPIYLSEEIEEFGTADAWNTFDLSDIPELDNQLQSGSFFVGFVSQTDNPFPFATVGLDLFSEYIDADHYTFTECQSLTWIKYESQEWQTRGQVSGDISWDACYGMMMFRPVVMHQSL